MAKLKDFLLGYAKSGSPDMACFYDKKTKECVYYESDHSGRPAAVYLLDHIGKSRDPVYSYTPKGHWLRTYMDRQIIIPNAASAKIPDVDVIPKLLGVPGLRIVGGFRKVAPPIPGAGLYATAEKLSAGSKATGMEKGMERAMRYYMLAAYSVLGLCKHLGYKGGNYVAAIMVSDQGEILSFGVNSGSFHHAEVNMLLSYFSRSKDTKFQAKSIVFSTLTPCEQCTKYLVASRPMESVIYFGQLDTGPTGSKGTSISASISDSTKPVHVAPITSSTIVKAKIDKQMPSCVDASKPNIAKQIGESNDAEKYLLNAVNEIHHKVTKDRSGTSTPDDMAEQDVKQRVLLYITEWLLTIDIPV